MAGEIKHQGHESDTPVMIQRWKRFAWLIAWNGGNTAVLEYGAISNNGGPFRQGLSQEEGFELISMNGLVNGMNLTNEGQAFWDEIIRPRITNFLEGKVSEWQASQEQNQVDEEDCGCED